MIKKINAWTQLFQDILYESTFVQILFNIR